MQKEKVLKLREQGLSFGEIQNKTGISKSVIHYYCNPDAKKARAIAREKFKLRCLEYKGGKCCVCGFDKFVSGLDFHHLDPSQKETGRNAISNRRSFENTKKELDKCVILCAVCHRGVHSGDVELNLT